MNKRFYDILLSLLCLCLASTAEAKEFYSYTEHHPLIIVCDWDFQPFEFLDSDGQPAGYNVEVLDLILNRLNIPHKFVMQEWHEATMMFEHHDADLIHALSYLYNRHPYVTTQKYINYYNLRTARHVNTPPLMYISDLKKGDTILTLEVMKMETPVVAPEDGTVASIDIAVGKAVEAGELLATLN